MLENSNAFLPLGQRIHPGSERLELVTSVFWTRLEKRLEYSTTLKFMCRRPQMLQFNACWDGSWNGLLHASPTSFHEPMKPISHTSLVCIQTCQTRPAQHVVKFSNLRVQVLKSLRVAKAPTFLCTWTRAFGLLHPDLTPDSSEQPVRLYVLHLGLIMSLTLNYCQAGGLGLLKLT